MASLTEIAEIIAERKGRQLDNPFIEEIKVLIGIWRSKLLHDTLESKRKDRPYFVQYFEVPLIVVNVSELPGFPDSRIVRTKCPMPSPVRANGIMFDYVGSPDKISAFKLFTEQHLVRSAMDGPLTGSRPKLLWLNNYIYGFNVPLNMPYLGVAGIYDNLSELQKFLHGCGCAEFDDDSEYPISGDIQQRIIQAILSTEMRDKQEHDPKTVEIDGPNS